MENIENIKNVRELLEPRVVYNNHYFAYSIRRILSDVRDRKIINPKEENIDYLINIVDSIIKEEKLKTQRVKGKERLKPSSDEENNEISQEVL